MLSHVCVCVVAGIVPATPIICAVRKIRSRQDTPGDDDTV